MSKMGDKKGQLAIFVIIALVIIGVLAIVFLPQIKNAVMPPTIYETIPRECVQESMENALQEAMKKGGSLNPELYIKYENETVEYLCYTNEWYRTCVMQQPLLKQHIEAEIDAATREEISKCISGMENSLKRRGYSVKIAGERKAETSIIPDKLAVSFNMTMQIEKGEEKTILNPSNFQMEFDSSAYRLIMIAASILNWEARFGDSRQETWMELYPDIKVEKYRQEDGSKVYIITNRESGLMMRFATRSLAWPPGLYIP